jgi:hypothetical protein
MMCDGLDRLLALLGAHYGWTWSRHFREYQWRLLYWPPSRRPGIAGPQRRRFGPERHYAGFVDRRRGRHWDCRRHQ